MSTHCFTGYLKLTNVQSPKALLTITCNRLAHFSQDCWWNSNRGNFNVVPQVLRCSWFSGAHSVLKITPHVGTRLSVLSERIRVHTPHSPLPYPSSHSAKCDEHCFTHPSLTTALPYRFVETERNPNMT
jgi:hypothetical protein